jgi:hypothetical protein
MDRYQVARAFVKSVKDQHMTLTRVPDAAYEWVRDHSKLPYLPLHIDVPHDMIRREILASTHLLVPHRDGYESHGWSSFCLHGRAIGDTLDSKYYNDDKPMTWTLEALEMLPDTIEWIRSAWPHSCFHRVRVMCLEPGGWIGVHKDYELNQLGPVNIAITQPTDCAFYMQDVGVVPFEPGRSFWMDVSRMHTIVNDSDECRYHLIIHHEENEDWRKLVMRSYQELPCKD